MYKKNEIFAIRLGSDGVLYGVTKYGKNGGGKCTHLDGKRLLFDTGEKIPYAYVKKETSMQLNEIYAIRLGNDGVLRGATNYNAKKGYSNECIKNAGMWFLSKTGEKIPYAYVQKEINLYYLVAILCVFLRLVFGSPNQPLFGSLFVFIIVCVVFFAKPN